MKKEKDVYKRQVQNSENITKKELEIRLNKKVKIFR